MGFVKEVGEVVSGYFTTRAKRKAQTKRLQGLLSDINAESILAECLALRKDLNKHIKSRHDGITSASSKTTAKENKQLDYTYEELLKRASGG